MLNKKSINSGQMLEHLKADTLSELHGLIIVMRENGDIVKPLKTDSHMFWNSVLSCTHMWLSN